MATVTLRRIMLQTAILYCRTADVAIHIECIFMLFPFRPTCDTGRACCQMIPVCVLIFARGRTRKIEVCTFYYSHDLSI